MSQPETSMNELLRRVPLFAGLTDADLRDVARAAVPIAVETGGWVFREGDAGEALFVVEGGTLEAVLDAERASERVVTTFTTGDFFGEMALLTGEPRSASVRCTSAARLLRVGQRDFNELVQSTPSIAVQLSRVLSSRLAATNEQLTAHTGGVSIVIRAGHASAIDALLARATDSIARQTGRPARLVPADGPDAAGVMLECRRSRTHVVAVATMDTILTPTGMFRRGVDVWFVAESAAALRGCAADMAVLDRAGYRVRAAYIGARGDALPDLATGGPPPVRIVRAREGTPAVDSFARALIGATIGVALSGGAAQGTAHVGVLEALVRAGVPIDLIAGTSGGALYGSLLASGLSVDQVKERVIHNTRRNLRDRSDYTLPRLGLLRGASIERMIHESTDGARFEDLVFPLYAVAADLATGEEVVVERGPVSHGVRASISVPGIFEPFPIDGRMLVDGGVVNALPVSVCRSRGANFVIAVSVPAPGKLKQGQGAPRYNIVSVVVRSYYFAGDVIANAAAADADVLIKPAVETFGWRDYKSSPEIIEAGRRAGEEAIGRVRERIPLIFSA